jgi:hypothetical protein
MNAEILQPLTVLAGWTMVMWVWMYAVRIPAMGKLTIDTSDFVKQTPVRMDDVMPAKAQWKAHNYNHLHEAPTVFYAVALALAFMGGGNGAMATVAWAYVGLRIAHSLVQAIFNHLMLRFGLFILSTLCLMCLVLNALQLAFKG